MDDLERLSSLNEERIRQLSGLEARMRELAGTGEAANGLIRARVDSEAGLSGLVIDPRALRQGSETLAEQVIAAVGAANADLRAQIDEVMREALGDAMPSTDVGDLRRSAKEQIAQIEAGFRQSMEGIMADVEKLKRSV
ncbi:YbaB/EbfC family nucleoid-associated protein [Dactylosporangium sp. CS-047395]|uniref:YbaB/EbfC family nucleoid-associated protein n=1 Tax=Dactylosporangium sp. CS-047395 TaxID=3239936 RepID=UPI003D8B1613